MFRGKITALAKVGLGMSQYSIFVVFDIYLTIYLFTWLHQVLDVSCRVF